MKKLLYISQLAIAAFAGVFLMVSCEDLLEQKPPDTGSNVLPSEAIQSASDLQEVLVSSYDVLANTYNGNAQNLPTLLSDVLIRPVNQDDYTSVWLRSTSIFNGAMSRVFSDYYIAVLRANTVIEGLDAVEISADERGRIEGEARFVRALCHFDVLRCWAFAAGYTPANTHPGVAIRTSSQIENGARANVEAVYNLILSDLEFAKANLPEVNSVYATNWAAIALEAEVRFQRHEYTEAYALANEILSTSPYLLDTNVNKFQHPVQSPEAIFYIYSAVREDGSVDNRATGFRNNYFGGGNPSLRIQPGLYNEFIAFGAQTPRAELYTEINQDGNITYATKMFDQEFLNIPILTITQMQLIRAEAGAEIGVNIAQSIEDINEIRERAYGNSVANLLPTATAQQIIAAARVERKLEFPFTGQRYFDLVRMGAKGENIVVRDAPWDCPGMILQFPSTEQTELFPLNQSGGC